MNMTDRTFLSAVALFFVAAICSTAYIFLIEKEYEFVVEAPCDPAVDTCFHRDCSGGECPPNGLEEYRIFTVNAADFETCADETCLAECTTGSIACTEIACGDSEADVCSATERRSND